MRGGNAVARLMIRGELTIFTVAELRGQLLAALEAGGDVEVDLSEVGEIDSAGLQWMLAAQKEAEVRKQRLEFSGHSPAVLDVLALCRLEGPLGPPSC